ncbi:hypothetical protein GGF46_003976 [Coemansia sp. RSA 552]|nr:hypothetical protein GGF46_003976 [Coemansia sp. RSA 552]
MMQSGQEITILRIKRKRDQEPLEALVLHQQQQQQQHQQRRKVPRGLRVRPSTDSLASEWNRGENKDLVFALGETLSENDFGDSVKRRALQDRLASLSKRRYEDVMEVEGSAGEPVKRAATPTTMPQRAANFRVVGRREVAWDDGAALTPKRNVIPQVVAAVDLQRERERQRIKLLDAVNTDEFDTMVSTGEDADPYAAAALGAAKDSKVAVLNPQTVEELTPMVRDYLSFRTGRPEYVYDFYYVQQNQTGGLDPNTLRTPNVGSVLWVDDVGEFLGDSASHASDDDEDSNAEDFYRNDYPDEPDSDMGMDESYGSADEHGNTQGGGYDPEDYRW